ncbi:MAG: hypothetical protein ACFBZ8_11290 [Opitutales bacterium]
MALPRPIRDRAASETDQPELEPNAGPRVRGVTRLIPAEPEPTIEMRPKRSTDTRLLTLAITAGLLALAGLFAVAGYFLPEGAVGPNAPATASSTTNNLYINSPLSGLAEGPTEVVPLLPAVAKPAATTPVEATAPVPEPPALSRAQRTFATPAPAAVPAAVTDVDGLASFEKPVATAARADDLGDLVRKTRITALRFYGTEDPRNKVIVQNRLLQEGDTLLADPDLKIAQILQSAVILVDETGREFRKPVLGR